MLLQREKIVCKRELYLILICVSSFLLSSFFFYNKTPVQSVNQFSGFVIQDYALDDVITPSRQTKKQAHKEYRNTILNCLSSFQESILTPIHPLSIFYTSIWYKPFYYDFLSLYKLF